MNFYYMKVACGYAHCVYFNMFIAVCAYFTVFVFAVVFFTRRLKSLFYVVLLPNKENLPVFILENTYMLLLFILFSFLSIYQIFVKKNNNIIILFSSPIL